MRLWIHEAYPNIYPLPDPKPRRGVCVEGLIAVVRHGAGVRDMWFYKLATSAGRSAIESMT